MRGKKDPKKEWKAEIERRFYNRNIKAMKFCWNQDFKLYASAVAGAPNMVRLFMHKGENFKRLNDKLYNQSKPEEVMEYVALMDKKYEEMYNKMKNKVKTD